NDNALLTVFRHFDSATVVKGFVGQIPKTAWVLDFPLLERIHYLLVAGFDVFGNVGHKVETRLYMDFLRMEGENNFLSFLPRDRRKQIRAEWYKGARAEFSNFLTNPFHGLERSTRVVYETDDPKREFLEKILTRARAVAGPPDVLNRCEGASCLDGIADPLERRVTRALRNVARIKGPPVQVIPDVAFLHIVADNGAKDMVYSLIRNKALSNNSFMFGESRRRVVKDDTISVVKGYLGDYPNAFCRVNIDQIEEAVEKYASLEDKIDYYYLGMDYAVRRTSPDFWKEADWHYRRCLDDLPVEGGQFDMNRFERIAQKTDQAFKW
ncbi:MAG: isomerase, partial [Desulfobacterales bacterium]|nr:isomerase [Desulfobacterales bacterium]